MWDDFSRKTLVVDGLRLPVFEAGDGEPVLLLHGYPQSHHCYRAVALALARTHRVIVPDWFGWGESERDLNAPASYEADVARIGLLLDALSVSCVNLIGHDYGGLIGLGFSVAHPDRVARLALINTRAHRRMASPTYAQWWLISWAARLPGLRHAFARLPWRWLHQIALRRHVRNGSFSQVELDRYLHWMAGPEKFWFLRFCSDFRVRARCDLEPGMRRFEKPVAVIWGDRDRYFPFSIAEDLQRLLPTAVLTRIEGADHYVLEQRPADVSAAVQSLLATPIGLYVTE